MMPPPGPRNCAFYKALGDAYKSYDFLDQAETNFLKSIGASDFVGFADADDVHNSLGNIYLLKKSIGKAVLHFRRAKLLNPTSALYHCNLGIAYDAAGRIEMAKQELRRALEINPKYEVARDELDAIEADSSVPTNSQQIFNESNVCDALSFCTRFEYTLEEFCGKHEKFYTKQELLSKSYKAEVIVLLQLRHLYGKEQLLDFLDFNTLCVSCKAEIMKVNSSDEEDRCTDKWAELAVQALRMNNSMLTQYKLGLFSLMDMVEARLESQPSYVAFLFCDTLNDSICCMIKASLADVSALVLSIKPKSISVVHMTALDIRNAEFYKKMGDVYWKVCGDLDEAETNYLKCSNLSDFTRFTERDDVHNSLGNIYYAKRNYTKAVEHCLRATLLNPGCAVFHSNLGIMYDSVHKSHLAENALRRALVIDPKNKIAKINLRAIEAGGQIHISDLFDTQ